MIKILKTKHGNVTLPSFFPDGTKGVVKGIDSKDLENAKVEGLVINTYHLLVSGLEEKIEAIGGIHRLMGWKKPVITDSGGFQVMSLIHKDESLGKMNDTGATFKLPGAPRIKLTPESSIRLQIKLDADILICLDDCTKPDQDIGEQEKSVERTIAWAKRCKLEFEKLTSLSKKRPLLFAVIQGGNNRELRKKCAKSLVDIGFDGYCFGGFPVDNQGKFLKSIMKYTASLLPEEKVKYAMGIGTPANIIDCVKMGYNLFDCVIPTREARHQKLYIFNKKVTKKNVFDNNIYSTINIGAGRYNQTLDSVSKFCDCHTCERFSRAYLHHLFKIKDTSAFRLATIHNLRFYSMLMEALKQG
ncbi:MAG: tRNA guanosine(34) transglycosylase Tgt [Candidatus Daviesbacteria bacterium]|nr:tRNA guanosine(34) transglycosylase Tgt [Candidatus Daviesbacteria bacterium]